MESGPSSITILELIFILVLVLINGFFAALEIAVISLNRTKVNRLADEGSKKAKMLLKLIEEPGKFFTTIKVGITLAGFLASAAATVSIAKPLGEFINGLNILFISKASGEISIFVVTVILVYITLVFGELVPKRLAIQRSEQISMVAIKSIMLIYKFNKPFVKLLTASTNFVGKLLGISSDFNDDKVTKEEIKLIIDEGEESGALDEEEKEMIEGIFDFDNTVAKEVMTPRTEVFVLDISTPMEEVVQKVLEEQYSRIPIFEGDLDNIIGILYMKDLFAEVINKKISDIELKNILRPAYFIPETKNIDLLFKELKENKSHMTVLIDEYGGFSGIVTIEDLIEEVMGNISDEYDEESDSEEEVRKLDDNTYLVDGLANIDDINDKLNLNLPSEHYDTVGGFVMDLIGTIPVEEEEYIVEYSNLVLKVEKIDERRIELVKICIQ